MESSSGTGIDIPKSRARGDTDSRLIQIFNEASPSSFSQRRKSSVGSFHSQAIVNNLFSKVQPSIENSPYNSVSNSSAKFTSPYRRKDVLSNSLFGNTEEDLFSKPVANQSNDSPFGDVFGSVINSPYIPKDRYNKLKKPINNHDENSPGKPIYPSQHRKSSLRWAETTPKSKGENNSNEDKSSDTSESSNGNLTPPASDRNQLRRKKEIDRDNISFDEHNNNQNSNNNDDNNDVNTGYSEYEKYSMAYSFIDPLHARGGQRKRDGEDDDDISASPPYSPSQNQKSENSYYSYLLDYDEELENLYPDYYDYYNQYSPSTPQLDNNNKNNSNQLDSNKGGGSDINDNKLQRNISRSKLIQNTPIEKSHKSDQSLNINQTHTSSIDIPINPTSNNNEENSSSNNTSRSWNKASATKNSPTPTFQLPQKNISYSSQDDISNLVSLPPSNLPSTNSDYSSNSDSEGGISATSILNVDVNSSNFDDFVTQTSTSTLTSPLRPEIQNNIQNNNNTSTPQTAHSNIHPSSDPSIQSKPIIDPHNNKLDKPPTSTSSPKVNLKTHNLIEKNLSSPIPPAPQNTRFEGSNQCQGGINDTADDHKVELLMEFIGFIEMQEQGSKRPQNSTSKKSKEASSKVMRIKICRFFLYSDHLSLCSNLEEFSFALLHLWIIFQNTSPIRISHALKSQAATNPASSTSTINSNSNNSSNSSSSSSSEFYYHFVIKTPEKSIHCFIDNNRIIQQLLDEFHFALFRIVKGDNEMLVNRNFRYFFKSSNMSYDGFWKNAKPHGFGTLVHYLHSPLSISSTKSLIGGGEKEKGESVGGTTTKGFLNNPNVLEVYEGMFVNNKRSGYGVMLTNDLRYEGNWKHNKKHGKGSLYYNSHKYASKFVGFWSDDLQHGDGELHLKIGAILKTVWRSGIPTNPVVLCLPNNVRYIGDLNADYSPSGHGICIYNNVDRYYGNWVNGMRSGLGMFVSSSAVHFIGEWQGDRVQGLGYLRSAKDDLTIFGKYSGDILDNSIELLSPTSIQFNQTNQYNNTMMMMGSFDVPTPLRLSTLRGDKWECFIKQRLKTIDLSDPQARSLNDSLFLFLCLHPSLSLSSSSTMSENHPPPRCDLIPYDDDDDQLSDDYLMSQNDEFEKQNVEKALQVKLKDILICRSHPLGKLMVEFASIFLALYHKPTSHFMHVRTAVDDIQSFLNACIKLEINTHYPLSSTTHLPPPPPRQSNASLGLSLGGCAEIIRCSLINATNNTSSTAEKTTTISENKSLSVRSREFSLESTLFASLDLLSSRVKSFSDNNNNNNSNNNNNTSSSSSSSASSAANISIGGSQLVSSMSMSTVNTGAYAMVLSISEQIMTEAIYSILFPSIYDCLITMYQLYYEDKDLLVNNKLVEIQKLDLPELLSLCGIDEKLWVPLLPIFSIDRGYLSSVMTAHKVSSSSSSKLSSTSSSNINISSSSSSSSSDQKISERPTSGRRGSDGRKMSMSKKGKPPILEAMVGLRTLERSKDIIGKLEGLKSMAQHVEILLKGIFENAFGADEFLPVFCLVLMMSNIQNVYSISILLDDFIPDHLRFSVSNYLISQLQIAISFIISCSPSSVSLQREFTSSAPPTPTHTSSPDNNEANHDDKHTLSQINHHSSGDHDGNVGDDIQVSGDHHPLLKIEKNDLTLSSSLPIVEDLGSALPPSPSISNKLVIPPTPPPSVYSSLFKKL